MKRRMPKAFLCWASPSRFTGFPWRSGTTSSATAFTGTDSGSSPISFRYSIAFGDNSAAAGKAASDATRHIGTKRRIDRSITLHSGGETPTARRISQSNGIGCDETPNHGEETAVVRADPILYFT